MWNHEAHAGEVLRPSLLPPPMQSLPVLQRALYRPAPKILRINDIFDNGKFRQCHECHARKSERPTRPRCRTKACHARHCSLVLFDTLTKVWILENSTPCSTSCRLRVTHVRTVHTVTYILDRPDEHASALPQRPTCSDMHLCHSNFNVSLNFCF